MTDRREIPIQDFDNHCRAGRITDAEIENFGDGEGEPYNPDRKVIGTLNGEKVYAIKKWGAHD